MKNKEAQDRLDQAWSAQVVNLFWIAVSSDSHELETFLSDMEEEQLKVLFPDIHAIDEYIQDGLMVEALTENDKLGFIAEVAIPKHYNFRYKDGEFDGCSISLGTNRHFHIYSEDLDGMISMIEVNAEKIFKEYEQEDKNSKKSEKG